jgi:hypothetical protein
MIATRYPCAFAGTALGLVLLFGTAPIASAQQRYPYNSNAIDQQLQQMVGLFPSMTPQQFMHWQMAMNQMLQAMPNDPNYNSSNPWGNPTNNSNAKTANRQNALFPGLPAVSPNGAGHGAKQGSRPNLQPGFHQQQFTAAARNHANCQPNHASAVAANRAAAAHAAHQHAAAVHHAQHHRK